MPYETSYQVYLILDVITVFLLLFFALFLFTSQRGNRLSNLLLAALMFSSACAYMDGVLIKLQLNVHYNYTHIVHAAMSFDYLLGPLLLLYLQSRIQQSFRLVSRHGLHFIAFICHFGYMIYRLGFGPQTLEQQQVAANYVFSFAEVRVLTSLSTLYMGLYLVWLYLLLYRYHRELGANFSTIKNRNLGWMLLLVGGFTCATLMRYANNLLWLQFPEIAYVNPLDLKLFAVMGLFVATNAVVFVTLQQPDILQLPANAKLMAIPAIPAKQALLPDSVKLEYVAMVRNYMERQKPYLDSDLTLNSFAQQLDIPAHHLSHVLNADFHKNFYEFVNGYRIEEAKDRLCAHNAEKITDIMYACGFNSKSVFNTTFRTMTGITPSQFRKANLPKTA
ncbi:helix-turn-helix domain-containing protein [Teredinibacter waterburyi]|uniref:helix-turn-helix domain-containing protein n=1 Tax=Teredinibacter waterburyi TaxID=1500538 RepID=UPI00165F090B|nr:helix-turn-helix domain-containing protein [Teredinibacter waterburyi]